MRGRGLAVAWAVFVALVGGTVVWLAVADGGDGDGQKTVVLDLPSTPTTDAGIPPPPEVGQQEGREMPAEDWASAAEQAGIAPAAGSDNSPVNVPQESPRAAGSSTADAIPDDAARPPSQPLMEKPAPTRSPSEEEAATAHPALSSVRLPPRPRLDPALVEDGPYGPLPIIAPDGRKAWRAYSSPFEAPADVPRIAVVISNLGLASDVTETAIRDLPAEITLAFAPYADDIDVWVAKARAAGHEVLLDLPMEPVDYPKNDPGPKALFSQLTAEENLDRLRWVLGRAVGYVGVVNFMGSRFTTSAEALRPILVAIRDRGLMFLDSRSASRSLATSMASETGLPRAVNDLFIDTQISREDIDQRLRELEEIAASQGSAVGIGSPYPITIERLSAWSKQVEKRDFVLAGISAVANHQVDR